MSKDVILKRSATLPEFLQDIFKCIDAKDFDSVKKYFSDDFILYFAHYKLTGVGQGLGFVGAFDLRLPKYEHVMGDIFVNEGLVTFDGTLRVWLEDGTALETPFWDKIEIDRASGKISKVYALFSIAAVPEKYWKDLSADEFG